MFDKYSLHNLHGQSGQSHFVTLCLNCPSKIIYLNPLSANPIKWPNTLKQFAANLLTNCLCVFGHFVYLALKGLRFLVKLSIIMEICGLKLEDSFLQLFFFSLLTLENFYKITRVISPFKHKVHNWRIQEFGCFYGDYTYHYCFVTVYQSHLHGHLVIISISALKFRWSYHLMF